jgi:hypothetical protein
VPAAFLTAIFMDCTGRKRRKPPADADPQAVGICIYATLGTATISQQLKQQLKDN